RWENSSCVRTLRGIDLLQNEQLPAKIQVKCCYFESESSKPSSHSDKRTVTVKDLAPPTLTITPAVITETDRVSLHCEPPSDVHASLCYFITESGKTLDNTHCTTAVTGSELLMVHQSPPAEVLIHDLTADEPPEGIITPPLTCCGGELSSKFVHTHWASLQRLRASPTFGRACLGFSCGGVVSEHVFSLTLKIYIKSTTYNQSQSRVQVTAAPSSENLVKMLAMMMTLCGVILGCVMMLAAFLCTTHKHAEDSVDCQDTSCAGQPLAGEINCRTETQSRRLTQTRERERESRDERERREREREERRERERERRERERREREEREKEREEEREGERERKRERGEEIEREEERREKKERGGKNRKREEGRERKEERGERERKREERERKKKREQAREQRGRKRLDKAVE
ncbi:hypothetical protein WMY93_033148, partial [Mugilogobius chulae]